MNDLYALNDGFLEGAESDFIVKGGIQHTQVGRFLIPTDLYENNPEYYHNLSSCLSECYLITGCMNECSAEVMRKFIDDNAERIYQHKFELLNNPKYYKVGVDKLEFTIDLNKARCESLSDEIKKHDGVKINRYRLTVPKANKLKFLHCIEITYKKSKVVFHYQPFGRNKSQKPRFAKISMNFNYRRRKDLGVIMDLIKNHFGFGYYIALKKAVPTHVELKIDFNSVHPCLLMYRGSSKAQRHADYQPRDKFLLESTLIARSSTKTKKWYFKTSESAMKNSKSMGGLVVARFEFVIKQHKGPQDTVFVDALDSKFFFDNGYGFKMYNPMFLKDPLLSSEEVTRLLNVTVTSGFHAAYLSSNEVQKKILNRYIIDTSSFMSDVKKRSERSLKTCKDLLFSKPKKRILG